MLKAIVKRTPGARAVALSVQRLVAKFGSGDFSSADYWDRRYRNRGNSGPGSYNRLALFKAETINAFVAAHAVRSVIEFGSGDGSQLALADYPDYVGVDVSAAIVEETQRRFANDPNKRFIHTSQLGPGDRAELSMSLDVIFHLVEDDVFDNYMTRLFAAATRYVVIYSSNFERRDARHVRHRRFTDWIERNRPDFRLADTIANPWPEDVRDMDNTSVADFFIYEKPRPGARATA